MESGLIPVYKVSIMVTYWVAVKELSLIHILGVGKQWGSL